MFCWISIVCACVWKNARTLFLRVWKEKHGGNWKAWELLQGSNRKTCWSVYLSSAIQVRLGLL